MVGRFAGKVRIANRKKVHSLEEERFVRMRRKLFQPRSYNGLILNGPNVTGYLGGGHF